MIKRHSKAIQFYFIIGDRVSEGTFNFLTLKCLHFKIFWYKKILKEIVHIGVVIFRLFTLQIKIFHLFFNKNIQRYKFFYFEFGVWLSVSTVSISRISTKSSLSPSSYAPEKTYQPVVLNMNDTDSEMESIQMAIEQNKLSNSPKEKKIPNTPKQKNPPTSQKQKKNIKCIK